MRYYLPPTLAVGGDDLLLQFEFLQGQLKDPLIHCVLADQPHDRNLPVTQHTHGHSLQQGQN